MLRQTASLAVHHAGTGVEVDATAVWGRNHTVGTDGNASGYLMEAEARIQNRQSIWMRVENDDQTTDLLGALAPPEERMVGRVQAYTVGYAHRLWTLELGAQPTVYSTPPRLAALYGRNPLGVVVLLHWRIGRWIPGVDYPESGLRPGWRNWQTQRT